MIIKTKLIPTPYSGITLWPFIFVAPWADATIIPHEMVHYKRQAWWSPVWLLLYLLVPSFRLKEEVLAYKESIRMGMDIQDAALWLTSYHTGVSRYDAVKLLEN
jgi:hypothetical protein